MQAKATMGADLRQGANNGLAAVVQYVEQQMDADAKTTALKTLQVRACLHTCIPISGVCGAACT